MSRPLPASLAKDNALWDPLTCPPHQQDLLCSCPGSCFPWTLCRFCHPEVLRHLEANCRQAKPQVCPVWRGGWSERASAPPTSHVGQQIPLKPAADESWCLGHGGQQGFLPGPLPGCRGARLSDCRAAFMLAELGFLQEGLSHCLSFVGWKERGIRRSTAPSSLPGAGAAPIPAHWAEVHWAGLEHAQLGCGSRHCCGTPTCGPVPQGQPHHVAAQVVGEAVHPLVIEPVTRCLLQLTAGQRVVGAVRGGGGCAPAHPRCCHNPRTQWAKSAGDWAETIHWAADRLSYILSKHGS